MTNLTKLIELIEYHSNTVVINIINSDPNFNPNSILRSKHSLVSTAVTYNNFEIFKLLVNHNKFDINANLNYTLDYPTKILKRVSMCDIYENRRYLEELYNLNYKFKSDHLGIIKNENESESLFNEIFEKIDKTYPMLHSIATRLILNTYKFKIVFDYIKTHFNEQLTKEQCDIFLKQALLYYDIGIVKIIKNHGFDIIMCNNKNSLLYIIDIASKDKLSLSYYCSLENIFYKGNLLQDFIQYLNISNYIDYYIVKKIFNTLQYILNNFEIIKPIYEKIEDLENNCILIIIINYIFLMNQWKSINDNSIESIINDLITYKIIKTDSSSQINFNESILTITQRLNNLKGANKESHIKTFKILLTQLIYHGFKPNYNTLNINELMKILFTEEELKNMDEYVKNNAIIVNKIVKKVVKKTVKKVNNIVI